MKIGWQPHELEWLRAANTLPRLERFDALEDVALMCQRTFGAVARMAARLRAVHEEAAKIARERAEVEHIEAHRATSHSTVGVIHKPAETPFIIPVQRAKSIVDDASTIRTNMSHVMAAGSSYRRARRAA